MPVKKCTKNGKSGHKYGSSGKCYTGKDAKRKAHIQGYAMTKNGYKPKSKAKKR